MHFTNYTGSQLAAKEGAESQKPAAEPKRKDARSNPPAAMKNDDIQISLLEMSEMKACLSGSWGPEARLWAKLLISFDYDFDKALGALRDSKNVWGVVAALLMTVGFAGMLLAPSSFVVQGEGYDAMLRLIPFSYCLCGCTSLLAVFTSSIDVVTITTTKADPKGYFDVVRYITQRGTGSLLYMLYSITALLLALPLTTYAIFEDPYASFLVGLACTVTFFNILYYTRGFMIQAHMVTKKEG